MTLVKRIIIEFIDPVDMDPKFFFLEGGDWLSAGERETFYLGPKLYGTAIVKVEGVVPLKEMVGSMLSTPTPTDARAGGPECGFCGKPSEEVHKKSTGIYLFVCFPCRRVVG